MAAANAKTGLNSERSAESFRTVSAEAAEIEQRTPPLVARGTLYALIALLSAGVLWATYSEIDRIVVARGRLITKVQPIAIQALETSVVRSIEVRVGQSVRKGDRLVALDPVIAEADTSQVKQRLGSIEAEVERLEAELAGEPYPARDASAERIIQADLYKKRMDEYEARLKSFRADLSRYEADLSGTQRSIALLAERVRDLKQIEAMKSDLTQKQYFSQVGLIESRVQRLEAEQAYEDATNKSKQLMEQIQQSKASTDVFIDSWRQKALDDLVEARRERDSLREQLKKTERRGTLVYLTAPYDAKVLEINKRSVGSVAKEADPIMTLVPQGEELEAEIEIAAEDIGFVRTNDPVRIKLDAFPFQKHGTVNGKLSVVGADSIAVDSVTAPLASRAFYPARINNLAGNLRAVPTDTRLAAGMTITAEIRVGKRSVISYFAYPLTKAFDEGLREP